ncbi:hypothetical protein O3Q52_20160 [Streptomyces sp. ActVer]|uniref:hypothetical protein n=1 Tax=Streptomyces sp. ActVer TaxID=3014558 RepID=UPI0022B4A1A0|nr:hypothetical protein [Streptomyces sp. ActVer]MCZ4510462.1 hypothetical protein [Streptomyces sp. ActVer]
MLPIYDRKRSPVRPKEYRDYLIEALKSTPGVQAVSVTESGRYPYALTVTSGGREFKWQVIGQLANGAKHDTPTAPVTAGPPAYTAAPADGAPDAWLAGVIGAAEPADTERLEVWSTRKKQTDPGLTVFFRNGERAFVRLL